MTQIGPNADLCAYSGDLDIYYMHEWSLLLSVLFKPDEYQLENSDGYKRKFIIKEKIELENRIRNRRFQRTSASMRVSKSSGIPVPSF